MIVYVKCIPVEVEKSENKYMYQLKEASFLETLSMVKTFLNLLHQNQKSYDLGTWHVASGTETLQRLYKMTLGLP